MNRVIHQNPIPLSVDSISKRSNLFNKNVFLLNKLQQFGKPGILQ